MRGVSKWFGSVQALDAVDLVIREGTVHALLGENGAGKSTLMRIAYGMLGADAGTVTAFGATATPSVRAARHAGIGMVHQHLSLVPRLTASENLMLGGRGLLVPDASSRALAALAASVGLPVPRERPAGELSIVEQQHLEILKALLHGARILILDEPTAVLAPAESRGLLEWIRRFAGGGGSVVLVTHKLREAVAVADDVTVLRRGRVTFTGRARDANEAQLANAIFPDTVPAPAAPVAVSGAVGQVVVRAKGVGIADGERGVPIRDATFEINGGDIVGVAAVEGSGHRTLLRALARLQPVSHGELALPEAVSFVPPDRHREALIPEFTLTENVALKGAGARRGLMPWSELESRTAALVARFRITAPSARAKVRTLSGGNQQRLVLARELEHAVQLLVADNPTRGLDMQATRFVHEQLRACAAGGGAVIVHSSDVDELLALATRMLVVFQGSIREVPLHADLVGRAMLGSA